MNLRNSKYKQDNTPLDDKVNLRGFTLYSKNYINHLTNSNEILASMIISLHNLNFYQELMKKIRETIKNGTFNQFYDKYIGVI